MKRMDGLPLSLVALIKLVPRSFRTAQDLFSGLREVLVASIFSEFKSTQFLHSAKRPRV